MPVYLPLKRVATFTGIGGNFKMVWVATLHRNQWQPCTGIRNDISIVDTLELSLLFFSEETLHKLPKSYKEKDPSSTNDPLQDALVTKTLLIKIIERFYELPTTLQVIYVSLLGDKVEFKPFFGELLSNVVYGILKRRPVFDRQFV